MLAHYDNFGYYTNDKGYYEGIPMGIAEPYPSDMDVVKRFLGLFPDRNNTYIDVGAHIGTTVMPFSRIYKNVIGYEPNSINYNFLEMNVKYNNINNISIYNNGLYSESCVGNIYSHKPDSVNHFYNIDSVEYNGSGCFYFKKEVNGNIVCKTLDDECSNKNIKNIDYIKIDTEGSELHVLKGSENTIKLYSPLISIEVNGLSERIYNIKENDIITYLESLEYTLFEKSSKSQNLFFYKP